MKTLRPVEWKGGPGGFLRVIDQRKLPARFVYCDCRDMRTVWKAIKTLTVRGAPAIGVAGAFGMYLGVRGWRGTDARGFMRELRTVRDLLRASRPTAVNLPWALDRVYFRAEQELAKRLPTVRSEARSLAECRLRNAERALLERGGKRSATPLWLPPGGSAARKSAVAASLCRRTPQSGLRGLLQTRELKQGLLAEAIAILEEDRAACRAIGDNGLKLLRNGMTVLTHCNAGALATSEYGTALAPIYRAHERGWKIKVFADETRPLLQGARLTAWELRRAGVDVTLLCDVAAASLLHGGKIDCVLVGADRVAANGDAANKVGTLMLATIAKECKVPFYALAPSSSFDAAIRSGKAIPIEHRAPDEVTMFAGRRVAARGVRVYNPAFDVTPAKYISAVISEKGIFRPPYRF